MMTNTGGDMANAAQTKPAAMQAAGDQFDVQANRWISAPT
jgi:hypothetical protein